MIFMVNIFSSSLPPEPLPVMKTAFKISRIVKVIVDYMLLWRKALSLPEPVRSVETIISLVHIVHFNTPGLDVALRTRADDIQRVFIGWTTQLVGLGQLKWRGGGDVLDFL
jgi:hypothetical protein